MSLKLPYKKISNNGDTIVEVLIALAVIGIVLAFAYSTTTRSTNVIRQTQERAEALKITESQAETTRSVLAEGEEPTDTDNPEVFCMDAGSDAVGFGGFEPPENYFDETTDTFNRYPDECKQGPGGRYHISVVLDDSAPEDTFLYRTRWERIGGGVDEVTLVTRQNQNVPFTEVSFAPPPAPPPAPPSGCTSVSRTIPEAGFTLTTIERTALVYRDFPTARGYYSSFPVDLGDEELSDECSYRLEFTIIETSHATYPVSNPPLPTDINQDQERGFLEGVNSSTGEVTFRTNPTDDIPECYEPAPAFGTPAYTACTQSTVVLDNFAPSQDTDRLVVKHLDYWDSSWGCPAGSPNDACTAQRFIGLPWDSFHGVEIRIIPI